GFTLSHAYGDNGLYTLTVTITDEAGAHGIATATVVVRNVAPTATFNAPTSVNEGSPIPISFTNPVDVAADLPALQYAFDCGDGNGLGGFGSNNSASCQTMDNGSRTVKGKVRDKDGGVTEYTAPVTILNVPPIVSIDRSSQTIQYSDSIA